MGLGGTVLAFIANKCQLGMINFSQGCEACRAILTSWFRLLLIQLEPQIMNDDKTSGAHAAIPNRVVLQARGEHKVADDVLYATASLPPLTVPFTAP